jgi:hypothetical protein
MGMRKYIFSFCLMLTGVNVMYAPAQPVAGKIVSMEHSIRWMNESNFPHYLKLPEVENEILHNLTEKTKQRFNLSSLEVPAHFDYRVIDMFGKSKIKWPKTSSVPAEIAIMSSLSRDVTNYRIVWSMDVVVRNGSKITYSNSIQHELEPVSYSCYLTKQRWLDSNEFTHLFIKLTDEALGIADPLPPVIAVGSMAIIKNTINTLLPYEKTYTLAVAGAMLNEQNSTYQLRKESDVVSTFYYKEGSDVTQQRSGGVLSAVIKEILAGNGLNVEYNSKIKETRYGTIESSDGERDRVKLTWLTLKSEGGMLDIQDPGLRPIAGEVFDKKYKDSVRSTFVYYKVLNTNQEELTRHNFTLTGTRGTQGVSDTHFIKGKTNGHDFEVAYPEQEGIVLISLDNKPVSALSMFNENKESRSFSGLKIDKNKKVVSSNTLGKPDPTSPSAEWYTFYTIGEIDEPATDEHVKLIIMLFFSISQTLNLSAP